jgi:carbamoyl-phosphate synthase large subunit
LILLKIREKFKNFVIKEELLQAESGLARSEAEALEIAKKINFPIVIRPSYVLAVELWKLYTMKIILKNI